tara:strand:- start:11434 stop:12726 length:1293 start_codon:yes stop_codon:yes gene_type:complete
LIDDINNYLTLLFPFNRSITGPDNEKTLKVLQQIAPLEILEYDSGEHVYDWTIPDEWSIEDAWIKDANDNIIVDFKENNIHVVGYSEAVNKKISFKELKENLFLHHEIPHAIPYRTSYYNKSWGFCVTLSQYKQLEGSVGPLEVVIKSKFNSSGKMAIGELIIPGSSKQEILLSTYICHPSLANDNLSGMLMTAFLARELQNRKNLKYTYRIIWVPETIGAISYCYKNEKAMKNIDMGLVVSTVGGPGEFGFKESWQSDHPINKLIEEVFLESKNTFIKYPFDIHGSDERQYSSQGFRINMATISKDKYYEYPEYHSSLDNLSLVKGYQIQQSLDIYCKLLDKFESRKIYKSLSPYCEVMLSKHDLYPKYGGAQNPEINEKDDLDIILWVLFLSDGVLSTIDISNKIDVNIDSINQICKTLVKKGILKEV